MNAIRYALRKLPERLPIRAAIADLLVDVAEKQQNQKIAAEGHWLSFSAKPNLHKVIMIYQYTEDNE